MTDPFDEAGQARDRELVDANTARTRRYMARVASVLRGFTKAPDGAASSDFRCAMHYLTGFCGARGNVAFPTDGTGAIDPLAMARMAGRREVFDEIVRLTRLTPQEVGAIRGLQRSDFVG